MNTLATTQLLLPWLILLPLLAAIISFTLPRPRARSVLSIALAALHCMLVLMVVLSLPETGDAQARRYAIGGWGAPLGIDLYIDGFAALMLAVSAVLTFVITLYSSVYFNKPDQAARFWPLWWLLITGLNAVFLAADAFTIYVTLEILGLAAVALVALQGNSDALQAALRYLLVSLLGSLCYLLGVVLLYRAYGVLDLAALTLLVQAEPLSWLALLLISAGLLLKTALFPLHFWLPAAHSSAPAPVSAVLSALVVKATFYLLARFWLDVLAPATSASGLQLLGVLGAGAVLWGTIQAIRAQRLKMIVAYSTVAQLGYLFFLFPLFAESETTGTVGLAGNAVDAVAYFIIAHACAKAAMFLAAGNIIRAVGHDDVTRLQGIARHQPLSLFAFAIAGASLIGLPPSGGFIAKWLLLSAAIDNGQWWWVVITIAGGLLASVYLFRVLNLAFTDESTSSPATIRTLPALLPLSAFALAIIALLLGFNALWVLQLLDIGADPVAITGAA